MVEWRGRYTHGNVACKPEVLGRDPDVRHLGIFSLEVAQNLEVGQGHAEVRREGLRTGTGWLRIIKEFRESKRLKNFQ